MQPDAFALRDRENLRELGRIDVLALFSPDRRFDGEDRHARRHAGAPGLIEQMLDLVGGERGAARRQRHQCEAAESLRTVPLVLIEVALFLDDDAARSGGECPHRHVVGERARGHEDRTLFTKQPRAARLQFLDDAAEGVRVGRHRFLVEQARQQRCVLRGCESDAVAGQADRAIGGIRGSAGGLRPGGAVRQRGQAGRCEKAPPAHAHRDLLFAASGCYGAFGSAIDAWPNAYFHPARVRT